MLIFLTIAYYLSLPIWDIQKRRLAAGGSVSRLTIINLPNLVGHPLCLIVMWAGGLFSLPRDPHFYGLWFVMIVISAISLSLTIKGLTETHFAGTQVLMKLGFISSSLAAVLFLHEPITPLREAGLAMAALGIAIFLWPERGAGKTFEWDRGVMMILTAVILSGGTALLYKTATFHAPDYRTFATGRFIGDLTGWSALWLGRLAILKRNPVRETAAVAGNATGLTMIAGVAGSTLLSSWLIYKLPLSTFAMLSILTVPSSYLISHFYFHERMPRRMNLGALCIVAAVIVFLM